jgi:hypothetical protein
LQANKPDEPDRSEDLPVVSAKLTKVRDDVQQWLQQLQPHIDTVQVCLVPPAL